MSNAIKFTPDGGHINLSLYGEGDRAVIEIADTGIGIGEEDLKHIFERFYQADTSRVRNVQNAESSGLGLSIVKWIVEAHNGSIDIKSALGEGTTFIIRIPLLNASSAPADEEDSARQNGLRRLKIGPIRRGQKPVAP